MLTRTGDVVRLAAAVAHILCHFDLGGAMAWRDREQLWDQHPEPVPVLVWVCLLGVKVVPVENWFFIDISFHLL